MDEELVDSSRLRLHNRVVAVAQQPLAHRVGVAAVCKWANLHMNQVVRSLASRRHRIAMPAQCSNQYVGIFGVRNRRNLHHDRASSRRGSDTGRRQRWLHRKCYKPGEESEYQDQIRTLVRE